MYDSVIPRETPNIAGSMMSPTTSENHILNTEIATPQKSSICPERYHPAQETTK